MNFSQQKPVMNQTAAALYQQALLAHHKKPTGYNAIFTYTHCAEGENPACGDDIVVTVHIKQARLIELGFSGDSCAICRASASIMCQHLTGKSIDEVIEQASSVEHKFTQQIAFEEPYSPFNSVLALPIRHQCALLPWRTLVNALKPL